jgi:hypothetical protein
MDARPVDEGTTTMSAVRSPEVEQIAADPDDTAGWLIAEREALAAATDPRSWRLGWEQLLADGHHHDDADAFA